MKIKLIFFIIVITGIAFGYWGWNTDQGNKVFDEMDGLIPFFVLLISSFLLLLGSVIILIKNKRSDKR